MIEFLQTLRQTCKTRNVSVKGGAQGGKWFSAIAVVPQNSLGYAEHLTLGLCRACLFFACFSRRVSIAGVKQADVSMLFGRSFLVRRESATNRTQPS